MLAKQVCGIEIPVRIRESFLGELANLAKACGSLCSGLSHLTKETKVVTWDMRTYTVAFRRP